MKDPNADPWTYQEGVIFKAHKITEAKSGKAYLLEVYLSLSKKWIELWVPKKQVDFEEGHVWIPMWLLNRNKISPKERDPEMNFEEE